MTNENALLSAASKVITDAPPRAMDLLSSGRDQDALLMNAETGQLGKTNNYTRLFFCKYITCDTIAIIVLR